jgi:hypothetical protein
VIGSGTATGHDARPRRTPTILPAAIDGVVGYAEVEFWLYAEMREVTLPDTTTVGLLAIIGPFALFMIPFCSWQLAC